GLGVQGAAVVVGDGGVAHQDGGSGHIVYLVERCGGGFLVQKVLAKGCTVVVVARAGQYGKGQVEQEGGFAVLLGGVVVGDVSGDQECVGALGQRSEERRVGKECGGGGGTGEYQEEE